MKIVDPGDEIPWRILISGFPGSGKTVLAAQAPNAFIVDTERSRESLLNHPELAAKFKGRIAVSEGDFNKDIAEIRQACVRDKEPFDTVETIIVDTISAARNRLLQVEMQKSVKSNPNRHIDEPSQNEYSTVNSRMIRALNDLLQTEKNIIILAHVHEDRDSEGTIIRRAPGVPPAVREMLNRYISLSCFLEAPTNSKGETRRTLHIKPAKKFETKNRIGTLPDTLEEPTFDQILEAINQQRKNIQ